MHWTDRILDADRSAFLAINGAHNPALDTLMWYVSGSVVWVPLYLLFLVLIKVRWGWRGLWWSLAAVAVLVSRPNITFSIRQTWASEVWRIVKIGLCHRYPE